MADNPGQFPREDQQKISSKGGQASSSKQDMSKLGKMGAKAQSKEDKAKGGHHSHGANSND